eukprot:CAMPEP_0197659256 /NCGR_PEP_ID=MMETSP1338-20131121/46871_1 /TAXON_ID=43686 ORGANISM="Pelagodinium beii, Strain RCC1491" /NCGR_SAMPLE_ID=MMETSP1338 /ASSEMBLY_ACC=CAM_ASM_000754 /LENGTH=322 /DNA_ID=CAMNT_0043236093 /DNA_START=92 /DNA_END=1062 /DNA_ORIENTATION=+
MVLDMMSIQSQLELNDIPESANEPGPGHYFGPESIGFSALGKQKFSKCRSAPEISLPKTGWDNWEKVIVSKAHEGTGKCRTSAGFTNEVPGGLSDAGTKIGTSLRPDLAASLGVDPNGSPGPTYNIRDVPSAQIGEAPPHKARENKSFGLANRFSTDMGMQALVLANTNGRIQRFQQAMADLSAQGERLGRRSSHLAGKLKANAEVALESAHRGGLTSTKTAAKPDSSESRALSKKILLNDQPWACVQSVRAIGVAPKAIPLRHENGLYGFLQQASKEASLPPNVGDERRRSQAWHVGLPLDGAETAANVAPPEQVPFLRGL